MGGHDINFVKLVGMLCHHLIPLAMMHCHPSIVPNINPQIIPVLYGSVSMGVHLIQVGLNHDLDSAC